MASRAIQLSNPAPTHHNILIVKNCGLPRRNRPLGLVKRRQNLIVCGLFDQCRCTLVTMTDLHLNSHRIRQVSYGNEIGPVDTQGTGIQLFLITHYDLARISLDLDDVERRARGHAQSLALTHSEIVNAAVFADDLAVGGNQFASRVR